MSNNQLLTPQSSNKTKNIFIKNSLLYSNREEYKYI